ncbi:MAG TPA: hypothetical protein VHC49_01275 [Mycobacteriales bacterium]|nr:hypothetical protein [Mycobacteriales bacterium]
MTGGRGDEPPFPHPELGLTFWWDVRKLWSADLPVVAMPVAELEWVLEHPFWKDRAGRPTISGSDVAARPADHPEEYRRTMAADLSYPINVILLNDRWVVMDGLHRLLKARILGESTILAKQARPADIPKFSRAWWEPHHHPPP